MLILTRKVNESITIGHNIRVSVIGIRGNHIRLGIDAPKSIPVNRTEVYHNICQENLNASRAPRDLAALTYDFTLKNEKR